MTITPEQALELLDGATTGPWCEDESNILNHDGDPLLSDGSFGDPNWYNDHDLTLMTAAPDLAQTVIEQADKIKRLENALIDHLKAEGERK